jgi:hypothetical protein
VHLVVLCTACATHCMHSVLIALSSCPLKQLQATSCICMANRRAQFEDRSLPQLCVLVPCFLVFYARTESNNGLEQPTRSGQGYSCSLMTWRGCRVYCVARVVHKRSRRFGTLASVPAACRVLQPLLPSYSSRCRSNTLPSASSLYRRTGS